MGSFVRAAAAALALGTTGFVDQQPPVLLACHGDFAQFANGFMVARPMALHFVVDWLAPTVVPTDGGSPGRILALTALELTFEVQYEGYRVAYHVNRIDGTISQRPNLGGVFFGSCDTKPVTTRF
jgi:hypothetical protein